jgi:TPR repeat protein
MNNLGMFYALGRGGLARNEEEAERLFRLAAAKGNLTGRSRLAALRDKLATQRGAAAAAEPAAVAEARKREEARKTALLDKRAEFRQAMENGKTERNGAAAASRIDPTVSQSVTVRAHRHAEPAVEILLEAPPPE